MSARAGPPPTESAVRSLAVGLVLPLAAGAACVFAFAPFYAWPVAILAVAALFLAWSRSGSPRQAALSGYAFGLGYFLTGVSWVYVSLHDFGSMPAILAAAATFLFCAWLSVFPAAAGWIAVKAAKVPGPRRLAMAAAAFMLTEWLRGWHFTGFPWLELGTSQASASPLAGFAPYLGSYGVSLAVAGVAALLAIAITSRSRTRIAALGVAGAIFLAGALAPLIEWTRPAGPPVAIGLLQGNVAQEMKWREEVRTRTLAEYRRMILETRARIVVVPETALPAFLDQLPADYVQSLVEHGRAQGKEILLGTVEREFRGDDFSYYNSVVRLAPGKMPSYRKRHLVPFGEFIPPGFPWVLAVLKIPMSDFTSGEARQPPLEAAGVRFGVAICYEDMFGQEVIAFMPSAQVLLNVSNMAWFGETWAADQHLQASQMRALETGRWMVRSTNTGITAAIDERGRVVSRLPAYTQGALVEQVTPREGRTPYALWGNIPALLLAAALAFAARAPRL